jgi:DNA-binding GntR family transcriptional regulator
MPAKRRRPSSTEAIVERITAAVLEHRLAPGAKLGEESLGELFGVSRTKVRQALIRLAQDKQVTLLPARGAFVAQPTAAEAREVFDARRAIERVLTERFAACATKEQLGELREHLARERVALAERDAALRNRLLGEFHVRIAEMAGNSVLAEVLRELVSRSSLITLIHQDASAASCSAEEHTAILDALRRRDAALAVRLMDKHLSHVERALAVRSERPAALDLRAALAEARR